MTIGESMKTLLSKWIPLTFSFSTIISFTLELKLKEHLLVWPLGID